MYDVKRAERRETKRRQLRGDARIRRPLARVHVPALPLLILGALAFRVRVRVRVRLEEINGVDEATPRGVVE